jgi:hypothetical protein
MTDTTTTADIVAFRKKPLTGAQRAAAYRARKRDKAAASTALGHFSVTKCPTPVTPTVTQPVTPVTIVTPSRIITPVTPSRRQLVPGLLTLTAFGLALVGITMNGWFAHSLGSSAIAGWLFCAIGVAADLVALAVPSAAARHWQAHKRGTALAGWLLWLATFAFAVTAGIGFASLNISDVTQSRASRITPAVTSAQAALADAVTARDRECKGGVGKFCREREATVTERTNALNAAMATVERAADPQTDAAIRIVAWISGGTVQPRENDFAMLRLILLSLLPQLGGILLMVGRT